MDFGAYVGFRRKQKGITVRETARRAELGPSYVSQLETGKIKKPSAIAALKLCEVLDIDKTRLPSFGIIGEEELGGLETSAMAQTISAEQLRKAAEFSLINEIKRMDYAELEKMQKMLHRHWILCEQIIRVFDANRSAFKSIEDYVDFIEMKTGTGRFDNPLGE